MTAPPAARQFCGAVTDPAFDGAGAVPLCLRAGGVTIHHARTLHASMANTSDDPRRFLVMPYFAADAFPLAYPTLLARHGKAPFVLSVADSDAWSDAYTASDMVLVGLGPIVALYCRSSTLYQTHQHIRCPCFLFLRWQCGRTPRCWVCRAGPRASSQRRSGCRCRAWRADAAARRRTRSTRRSR